MAYSNRGLEATQQKDKRIVYQNRATNILNSMPNELKGETEAQYTQAVELAHKLAVKDVERTYKVYPFPAPPGQCCPDFPKCNCPQPLESKVGKPITKVKGSPPF